MRNNNFRSMSELTAAELAAIRQARADIRTAAKANILLVECSRALGLSDPNPDDIEMAAKILAALPCERIPRSADGSGDFHSTWLLTESWILQDRNPEAIHAAVLRLLQRGYMQSELRPTHE